MFSAASLKSALETLGEVLDDRALSAEVVVVGGGSLLLLGLLERPTKDLDVVALLKDGVLATAKPLPHGLSEAVADVGEALGLATNWLNGGPTSLLDFGLPDGFEERMIRKQFGPLTVHIAARFDQICFKLYAAVDQGPHSKHASDLRLLEPSEDQLTRAADWCRTHDPSEGFSLMLEQALREFGARDDS